MSVTVHHGDSREVLQGMAAESIDACVCDPPYALVSISKRFGKSGRTESTQSSNPAFARHSAGFMGQKWDNGEAAHDPAFWREVYRVLKPGAHVVAFAGTRTYHRLACAIEDAGFEIRDMVAWLYGSGFPKSHDVSKGIDKALGRERAKVRVAAPKNPPNLVGGVTNGSDRPWRIEAAERGFHEAVSDEAVSDEAVSWQGWGTALKPALEPIVLARKPLAGTVAGNVLAHGCGALNIDACRIVATVGDEPLKWESPRGGIWRTNSQAQAQAQAQALGRWPANVCHDGSDEVVAGFPDASRSAAQAGEPIRKRATGADRDGNRGPAYGAESRPAGSIVAFDRGDQGSAARFFYEAKADAEDRLGSKHPTVKPVALMRWLCRLVTPPGGVILDPFAGTGTTGLAAMAEGFDAILVEREDEYVADIRRRLAWANGQGRLTSQEMARRAPAATIRVDDLFADCLAPVSSSSGEG